MSATHVIIGGGTAGCVLAARLSEAPANRVVLIEAGPDFPPGRIPADILDSYAGYAWVNPAYYWPQLTSRRGSFEGLSAAARRPQAYEQARLIGGGSSINGQVALRGAPEDYDRWPALGAAGWDWNSILPHFRRLERDLDFAEQPMHGSSGPIPIRRTPRHDWDSFTNAVSKVWQQQGYPYLADLNGPFADGYGPLAVSNDGVQRISTAMGYLGVDVRRRSNLRIRCDTTARRLIIDNGRAVAVEIAHGASRETISAHTFVLAAGAIHSPALLMRSGIGPGPHLQQLGIPVRIDRPGVGANLQDHPAVSISAYLAPAARPRNVRRRNYAYLRYTSGVDGCRSSDMIMMAICRSGWHAVGSRLATLATYVGETFSRGAVRLVSPDPDIPPDVCLNLLADPRDRQRATAGLRRMAAIIGSHDVASIAFHAFPSTLSERVKRVGRPTRTNAALTTIAAGLMDSSALLRRFLISNFITDGRSLSAALADDKALENLVMETAVSCYHVAGTCRMGSPLDQASVVESSGRVIGTQNLLVADASIMPEISRHNTALPTIMIAEKIAANLLHQERGRNVTKADSSHGRRVTGG